MIADEGVSHAMPGMQSNAALKIDVGMRKAMAG